MCSHKFFRPNCLILVHPDLSQPMPSAIHGNIDQEQKLAWQPSDQGKNWHFIHWPERLKAKCNLIPSCIPGSTITFRNHHVRASRSARYLDIARHLPHLDVLGLFGLCRVLWERLKWQVAWDCQWKHLCVDIIQLRPFAQFGLGWGDSGVARQGNYSTYGFLTDLKHECDYICFDQDPL